MKRVPPPLKLTAGILGLLSALVFTPGCGEDPALKAAREQAAEGGGDAAGQPAGAPTPGTPGQPQPGTPDEPTPAAPGTPQPGEPGEPKPGEPGEPDGIPLPEGPTATIRGVIVHSDYKSGPVRIDVFDGDHSALGGDRPGIVTRAELAEPGPFSLVVSKGSRVWLSAFNDENSDGRPSPVEPFGDYSANPVVANGDVDGVRLELTRRDPPEGGR